ncbi:MAG: hypothetical protein WBM35_01100 [Candidatus Electrothrix sp.]
MAGVKASAGGKNGVAVLQSRFLPLQNDFFLLQDEFCLLQNLFLLLQGDFCRFGKIFSRYSEVFSFYRVSFSCTVSYLLSLQSSRPATASSVADSGVIVYSLGDDLFVVAGF